MSPIINEAVKLKEKIIIHRYKFLIAAKFNCVNDPSPYPACYGMNRIHCDTCRVWMRMNIVDKTKKCFQPATNIYWPISEICVNVGVLIPVLIAGLLLLVCLLQVCYCLCVKYSYVIAGVLYLVCLLLVCYCWSFITDELKPVCSCWLSFLRCKSEYAQYLNLLQN